LKIGRRAEEEQLWLDGLWSVGKYGWMDRRRFGLGSVSTSIGVASSVGRCLSVRLFLAILLPLVALSFTILRGVTAIAMEGTSLAQSSGLLERMGKVLDRGRILVPESADDAPGTK
jgi:hypothetical protein